MLRCAFGVVRYADRLAEMPGEPCRTLILTLAVIVIGVTQISSIMQLLTLAVSTFTFTDGRTNILSGNAGTKLPDWFASHQWSQLVTLVTSNVFTKPNKATSMVKYEGIELEVATLERAAFEITYLVPKRLSYEEALQVMESLTSLRPQVVQQLLESCTSVKTKRLFMHAAEQLDHPWLSRLDLSNIDSGSGRLIPAKSPHHCAPAASVLCGSDIEGERQPATTTRHIQSFTRQTRSG